MALVWLDNVCVTLTAKFEKGETSLPVAASSLTELCTKLGDGNHSYLSMGTSLGTEIVKITCNSGTIVVERAQSDTSELTGSKGTCLCFKVNKAVIEEYLGLGADICSPTIVTDQPDYITITAPTTGCEWKVNLNADFVARLDACCPEDTCTNCTLTDGTYENASITVINGKVCAVRTGTNIVYNGGGCCGCSE